MGLFCIYVLPGISDSWLLVPITTPAKDSGINAAFIFAFFVLTSSVFFAYASLPIYQVLEGYRLPSYVRNRLRNRHLRKFHRLKAVERRFRSTNQLPRGVTTDDLRLRYPVDAGSVRATRLGNALTSMESWSATRYHLDSQVMWHELQAISSDNVRKDTDEGRAPVDFFVSSIVHMFLLSSSAFLVGLFTPHKQALVIGVLATVTIPVSYRLAVNNTLDWAQSVKAMVNVGRSELASGLGLQLPGTLEGERQMWSAHFHAVELNNDHHIASYNSFRVPSPEASKANRTVWRGLRNVFHS